MERIVVVFDGTFDGFLTVVFDFFKKYIYMIYDEKMVYQYEFGLTYVNVEADIAKSDRVSSSLQNLSYKLFSDIQRAFLCYDEKRYINIFKYIKRAYEKRMNIEYLLGESVVLDIQLMLKNMTREYLHLCGFCRFTETSDKLLYCKIEPKCNLVGLLAIHFKDRFNTERFLIHDIGRNIAAAYDGDKIMVMPISGDAVFSLSDNERDYQVLWRSFFNSIGISGRRNKKLQNAMILKRHQKNALEFSDLSLGIYYESLKGITCELEVNNALELKNEAISVQNELQ